MKILVVEDEVRIASFLTKGLRAEGYAVEHVGRGIDALDVVDREAISLIVLDLGLPDIDGTMFLTRLRSREQRPPVIVVTARSEVVDRVEALDLGADDYIVKPFAFPELVARIRARLRERNGTDGIDQSVIESGSVALDLKTRRATVAGRSVDLTGREFLLLETFLRHEGQVLSREQLLSHVWGFDFDPGSNVVDVYVRYLRQKLGNELIATKRGVGYCLNAA